MSTSTAAAKRFPTIMGLATAACALMALCGPVQAGPYHAEWAQAHSDIKPDPAITFGTLPNGMRYAIMHNNVPSGALSLRLRIAAGSLQESDAQQGIAHMLEHMAFRGSKHFPDGELVKTLERLGLAFGADTNAFTEATETVYKLDMPTSGASDLETGLALLRDIGDGLEITDEAMKTERGVVLSEWRLSDTPGQHARLAAANAIYGGQRIAQRDPIGQPDIISKADAALVRSFYRAYYRPERATVIVVGNVDAKTVERLVAERFGDWRNPAADPGDPDLGKPADKGAVVSSFSEPGLPTVVSASWLRPYNPAVESAAEDNRQLYAQIGLEILNERLQQAAAAEDAPFNSAGVGVQWNVAHSAQQAWISADSKPGSWKASAEAERRIITRALSEGVTQAEVDRRVAAQRSDLQQNLAQADTRLTRGLADNLVKALEDNAVVDSVPDWFARFNPALDNVQASTVNEALRRLFTGSGPFINSMSGEVLPDVKPELTRIFTDKAPESAASEVATPSAQWSYVASSPAGAVVSRSEDPAQGATFVRFANGVELAVRHTSFSSGEIMVHTDINGGRIGLSGEGGTLAALLDAYIGGGLKSMDLATLNRTLSDKVFSVAAALNEGTLELYGKTNSRDLETELQVMASYVSDPGFRPVAFEQQRQALLRQVALLDTDATSSLGRRLKFLLHGQDGRWAAPTTDTLSALHVDDLKSWLGPVLDHGALQVSIVGDVDVDKAIALVSSTFGAMPGRDALTKRAFAAKDAVLPKPKGAPVVMRYQGTGKAALMVAWPAPEARDVSGQSEDCEVLSAIIRSRLVEAVRSRLGAGYEPTAFYLANFSLTGFGALGAMADTKPEQASAILEAIGGIISDLREHPVGADELKRALEPVIAQERTYEQSNDFIADYLTPPSIDPELASYIPGRVSRLEKVSAERVQAAARKFLVDANAYQVQMLPGT